jgi:hypothetical protein
LPFARNLLPGGRIGSTIRFLSGRAREEKAKRGIAEIGRLKICFFPGRGMIAALGEEITGNCSAGEAAVAPKDPRA